MAETAKAVTTLELGAEGGFQIPVSLKKIKQVQDVTLDTASPLGHPLGTVLVDLVTGKPVIRDDVQRGVFRVKPNKSKKQTWADFAPIKVEDLEVIEEVTKIDNFVIDHFVPLRDVPFSRVTDAYFLAPAEGMSARPLALLAKALRRTKRAGVFKLVKTTRQYLAVVYEQDGGLIVNTLVYSGDFGAVREAAEVLDRQDAKVRPAEVEMACALIEALASDASVIDSFEDDVIPLKADLVERALKGEPLPKSKDKAAKTPVAEDGLEARLRASIEQLESSASKRKKAPVAV